MQIPVINRTGKVRPYTSIPRINWAHPLAKGLVTYLYDVGGGAVIDLVTGKFGAVKTFGALTNTPTISTNIIGSSTWTTNGGQAGNNTNSWGIVFPTSTLQDNLTNAAPFSFASGYVRRGASSGAGGTFGTIFCYSDGPGNTPIFMGVEGTASTPNDTIDLFLGGGTGFSFAFAPGLNVYSTSAAAMDTSTTGVYYHADDVNGFNVHTSTGEATSSFTGDTPILYSDNQAGANTSGTDSGFNGSVFFGAAWKGRLLTTNDFSELHNNPWGFLIYPEDEMFAALVGAVAAAVVEAAPHFIGRMRQQPLFSLASLRQNQPSDTSGPLGVQADANTHFVGRFKAPTMAMLQGLRQNAALDVPIVAITDNPPGFVGRFVPPSVKVLRSLRENHASDISGPLPIQPETNTHFIGKFQPPKMSALQAYRQNPALDNPAVIIVDDPPGFTGRFVPPFMRVLQSLRQNPASDASSSVTQPETNTHFVGRFVPPMNWLLRSLRENHASDASALSLQPETNTHFVGKFARTAINLLPALRQNTANDFSTATTQAETNTHFIGRFAQLPMTLPLTSRQNQANDLFVAAPFDNPTHFVGKFTQPVMSGLRASRENTANDSSAPTPQADTETHFIARFVQTKMTLLQSSRQNQATDISTAVAQIFDWLVTARRRGRR